MKSPYILNPRILLKQCRFIFLFLALLISLLTNPLVLIGQSKDTTYIDSKNIKISIQYYNNGLLRHIVRTKDGKKEGVQEFYFNNGNLKSKTEFKEGKRNGLNVEYDSFNHLLLSETYKNGLLVGKQEKYHKNTGTLYTLFRYKIIEVDENEKSVKHGKFFVYSSSGNITSKGNYKEGKKDGSFETYYEQNGNIKSFETFKDNEKYGDYSFYFPNGNLQRKGEVYENMIVNGKNIRYASHGVIEEYYKNGVLKKSSNYNYGTKTGEWREYYENQTQKSQNQYEDGLSIGTSYYWSQNGDLTYEVSYKIITVEDKKRSVKHGEEKRYKNSQLTNIQNWENGVKQGIMINYYPNGQLASKWSIVDGQLDGPAIDYYDNGQLKSKRSYRKAIINGRSKRVDSGWRVEYDIEGRLQNKYFYDSLGNTLLTTNYYEGKVMLTSIKDIISLSYFPNGKLMAINIYNGNHYNSHIQDFYLNGKTRKISFQNPNNGISIKVNYTNDGQYVNAYSSRHHNPDSLLPSRKIINKYYKSIGDKYIPNPFYSDTLRNGTYQLQYANGRPLIDMEYQDNLPHGDFTFYNAISGDTVWHSKYSKGYQYGYFISKYSNGNINRRGEIGTNAKEKWYETYQFNGEPIMKVLYNDTGLVQEKREYHKNGQLKKVAIEDPSYSAGYNIDGKLEYESTEEGNVITFRKFYPESGKLKSINYTIDMKRDSVSQTFWPSGQLQYSTAFKKGKRSGPFENYAEDGSPILKGQFENGVRVGTWVKYKDGVTETMFYKDGKLVVEIPKKACACIDTLQSSSKLSFAPSLSGYTKPEKLIKYLPEFIKFSDYSSYKSIFYTGHYSDYSGNYGSVSMNLIMFKPLSVNIPANEQLKITFNPCLTKGYLSRMRISTQYNTDNPSINSTTAYPERISIAFLKGPIKSNDKDYEYFTAFFNTKEIRVSNDRKMIVNIKDDSSACFTAATIRNFLSVNITQGHPMIFNVPNSRLMDLSGPERTNFFGMKATDGSIKFQYQNNSKIVQITSECNYLLIGGNYVYGEIRIPCTKIGPDEYQIDDKTTLSAQSLKVDWMKRGFTRIKTQYSEEGKFLSINFFVE